MTFLYLESQGSDTYIHSIFTHYLRWKLINHFNNLLHFFSLTNVLVFAKFFLFLYINVIICDSTIKPLPNNLLMAFIQIKFHLCYFNKKQRIVIKHNVCISEGFLTNLLPMATWMWSWWFWRKRFDNIFVKRDSFNEVTGINTARCFPSIYFYYVSPISTSVGKHLSIRHFQ